MTSSSSKLLLLVIGLFLFSCSDSLSKENLIGRWNGHQGCKQKRDYGHSVFPHHFEFFSNDSFTTQVEMYKVSSGTWGLEEDLLSLHLDTSTYTFKIDTFRGNYFHFIMTDSNGIECIGSFNKFTQE